MSYRIAACQMSSQADKAKNLATAERLIDEAASLGAQMVGLPEMFNILGNGQVMKDNREPMGGETTQLLQRKARQHGIYVHGGSIPIEVDESDKSWNRTMVFDPAGDMIAKYDKIHLFDINIEGKAVENESARYEAGTDMVTFETEHDNMGLTICYDVRFPELYRSLTLAGARVIFQPSSFTMYTGKDHWETLIRARAIENQVYMVSPAQFGTIGTGKQVFGATMIVDPWGTVIAKAPERECVIVADVDHASQDSTRANLPCLSHRRPDIYEGAAS